MARGAAHILGWVLDLQELGFGDLFRARACQGSRGPLRMKISQGPYQKLVLLFSAAAVTTGTGAGIRAEKLGRCASAGGPSAAAKLTQQDNLIDCFQHPETG